MKLLLTSGGIINQSMVTALADLLGKPFAEASIVFIPTAANIEKGDKSWLIKDLNDVKNFGFKTVDIVDIAAIPRETWQPRLELADVFVFGGGNTFYLMYWMEKSGLKDLFPELLRTRVYVGISAGSIAACPTLLTSQSDRRFYYEDEAEGYTNNRGLGFINFHIRPHLNSPHFPNTTSELFEKLAHEIKEPLYAIDDQTALKVVDGKLEIVSEGKYLAFNT